MGAVFVFCCFCFAFVLFFIFLFPHKTGGVCKCASAIWTLSGVGFEEDLQASQQHGQDPLTRPLCVIVDPETWIGGGKIKDGLCFVENGSAGLRNPGGN